MLKTAYGALLTVIVVALAVGRPCGLYMFLERLWSLIGSHAICFGLGFLLFPLARRMLSRHAESGADGREGTDSALYGLDHGRLNIALPPPTMWMNMGYWETTLDFPIACRALLDEVLTTAKLLAPESISLPSNPHRALTIIDLGFGCGDQTMYLMQKTSKAMPAVNALTDKQRLPLIDRYVGVTLNLTQFQYAESRLTALGMLSRKDASPSIQIFCADAAQPASWSEELFRAAKANAASPSPPRDAFESVMLGDSGSRETWVLALDTLYHFSPSRQPILNHAYRELQASLMAFDLVLAEDASRLDRVLLMVVSILTGTPFANFVTAGQYRKMLVLAGYAEDGIEIRDVSEHVFAPLARFLKDRERQLGLIGLGIGAYRVARWMFGWWGRSGVVRGVIVVARR